MSVHQKKDGRWIVQYRIKGTDKLKTEYFGRGLENEMKARARNDELKLRSWKRRTPKRKSPFFYELFDAYLESKVGTIQESTADNLNWKMIRVIIPEIGKTEAINLTEHRMNLYVKKRLKTVKRTTVHRELTDIQAVLNWAVKKKLLTFNPIRHYEKPERDDEVIRPPSATEIKKLIENASSDLTRTICLSHYTGIRPGQRELFSRKWNDVDFDEMTIFVVSARKGGKIKYRNIPLHPDLYSLIVTWYKEDETWAKKKKRKFPEYIIHYRGKPIKSIKTAWRMAKEKAGITRRIRLYDIRHAFASSALKSGADLKSTSEILGHSRTDTTTRIYQHTDTEMHQDVINRVPSLIDAKTKDSFGISDEVDAEVIKGPGHKNQSMAETNSRKSSNDKG
jgi:integrase